MSNTESVTQVSSTMSHTLVFRSNDANCEHHLSAFEENICKFTEIAGQPYSRAHAIRRPQSRADTHIGESTRRHEWLTWFSCWTTFRFGSARVTFSFVWNSGIRWPSKFPALNYFTDDRIVVSVRWQCWCLRRCGDIRRSRSSSNVRAASRRRRWCCRLSRIADIIRLRWFRFFVQRERWSAESWTKLWT